MLTELAAVRQDHASARFSSSSRNIEKPPRKPDTFCIMKLRSTDTPVEGPGVHLRQNENPQPPPTHPGPARPHLEHTQSSWERWCQDRPVQMHHNISLLSALPPQQTLGTSYTWSCTFPPRLIQGTSCPGGSAGCPRGQHPSEEGWEQVLSSAVL